MDLVNSEDRTDEGYRRCVCGSDSKNFRINQETDEILGILGKKDLSKIL
jgi:toxin ParE1/3/4